jgi:hypothetical protein
MPVHRGKLDYPKVNLRYAERFREPTGLVANKIDTAQPKTKCSHGVFKSLTDPEGFAGNCTLCLYGKRNEEQSESA